MSTKWKQRLAILARVWAVVCPAFVLACNFLALKAKTSCDFMVSFYIAGLMLIQGKGAQIYPAPDCTSWKDAPINSFAHAILPGLPSELISNFMYSPVVALLMTPFAFLPPAWAVSAWQVFNLFVLVLSCLMLSRCSKAGAFSYFVLALLCSPIFATLFVGQTSIIFGLAPLAAAFYFCKKERPWLCGLMLSLLALKPQYFIVSLVATALMPQDRKKSGLGLLTGVLLLALLSASVLSWSTFLNWLHSLRLSEQFMGGQGYGMPSYLAASLPSAVLLLLPGPLRASLHLLIYALAFVLASVVLFLLFRRSYEAENHEDRQSRRLLLSLFAACFAECLCAPRLLLYDLSLFCVPLALAFFDSTVTRQTKMLVVGTIVAVDLYTSLCLAGSPNPLILVSILLAASLALIAQLRK